jgi:hypothetical protein
MNCNINHSLFLRSNGSLACWCDYGSLKTIQAFNPEINYASDVYHGKVYGDIRNKLAVGTMPFPSYCSKCMVLLPNAPFDDSYARGKVIEVFQVEPSLACQLDCPGCIPMKQRKNRIERTPVGHLVMDPKVFEKILRDFHGAGLQIRIIDYQGHGEPTLNREVWNMIRLAKSLYPDTFMTMCTHANLEFADHMAEAGLDQIIFAIDGSDQTSYAPYRIHGEFDKAYRFMSSFTAATLKGPKPVDTVWKHVLFRHNDSEEQLLKAQALAARAGVSELRFIISQLGPGPTRITDESEIPRLPNGPKVVVLNYKVSLDQLDEGMAAARAGIQEKEFHRASQSAAFVASMLKRLFADPQTVPPKFAGYLDGLNELAPFFPDVARKSIMQSIQHLSR